MKKIVLLAAVVGSMAMLGCETAPKSSGGGHNHLASAGITRATCTLKATTLTPSLNNEKVAGTLFFVDMSGGVHITGEIKGLEPNSKHAFHVHEWGDNSSADGSSAGTHYDPSRTGKHGLPDMPNHHAGDLGNLTAGADGVIKVNVHIDGISVAGATNPIVGRSIVLHDKPDDFTKDPTGGAGARIAYGVIGVAKPVEKPTVGTAPAKK